MERKSGVLMHISSLFGDYSIGSFGKSAKYFVDFLKDSGFSYWQVLPFCVADECNSPYKSYSAFGGNPFFVDLEILFEKGLITKDELEKSVQCNLYECEFERLRKERIELLIKASGRIKDKEEIKEYIKSLPHIYDFCRFMALKARNNEAPWYEWTKDDFDEEVFFAWEFIEYEFFCQWEKIREYANKNGIKIIGDVPIYVSHDSCDVWANKKLFLLDKDENPTHVAGVGPDYFSEDGQLWGNPLYNWEEMKKDGYKWWCERIKHMSKMFDVVRIDHFRAIESYWAIPEGEETAKNGEWRKGPGIDWVNKIKSVCENIEIIAEDLGDITPEVKKLVCDSGFPGMRVFQFGFLDEEDNQHLPHNYIKNCVAYTGTHDNNTMLGFIWEMDDKMRKKMLEYCNHLGDDWQSACKSVIKTILSSCAGLVIIPIQDLLCYGSDTRMNVPGKKDGNWKYRITKEQLDSIDKEYYKKLNKLYSR